MTEQERQDFRMFDTVYGLYISVAPSTVTNGWWCQWIDIRKEDPKWDGSEFLYQQRAIHHLFYRVRRRIQTHGATRCAE